MVVYLDTIELENKTQNQDNDGILEARTVTKIDVLDKRHVVELDIPGSSGNVLQDMGAEPVRIFLVGEFMGKDSKKGLEQLRSKYDTNQPVAFSSDLTTSVAEVSKVLIEHLYVEEIAASVHKYRYHMVLKEHKEPRPQQQQQAPKQQAAMQDEIDDIRGQVVDKDDKPLPGINVRIRGPNKVSVATTDQDGYYEVTDVPEGEYEITFDTKELEGIKRNVTIRKGG